MTIFRASNVIIPAWYWSLKIHITQTNQ